MKKLIIIVICIFCVIGCTYYDATNSTIAKVDDVNTTPDNCIVLSDHNKRGTAYIMVDINYHGETHEYLYNQYHGTLTHWAGCKYCKQDGDVYLKYKQ